MPGVAPPTGGIHGFWAAFQGLTARIANLEKWQRTVVSMTPGTITQWGGSGIPGGALQCNGATVAATSYPALWYAQGNTSPPTSSSTITLPNISTTPITVIWT